MLNALCNLLRVLLSTRCKGSSRSSSFSSKSRAARARRTEESRRGAQRIITIMRRKMSRKLAPKLAAPRTTARPPSDRAVPVSWVLPIAFNLFFGLCTSPPLSTAHRGALLARSCRVAIQFVFKRPPVEMRCEKRKKTLPRHQCSHRPLLRNELMN